MIYPLREELRALARELQSRGIPLIIGGGYGLVLRTEMIAKSGYRTLIPDFPSARSTEDLDIFLKAEVISDPEKTAAIREALDRCGYEPVVPNFQFERDIDYRDRSRSVKVDLLAAPVPAELSASVKVDSVRIRPRGGKGLHAHVTPEALTVEESMILIDIGEARRSCRSIFHTRSPICFSSCTLCATVWTIGMRTMDATTLSTSTVGSPL